MLTFRPPVPHQLHHFPITCVLYIMDESLHMSDVLKKTEYLEEFDVSLELNYRLNFDGERSCGFCRVYKGDISKIELDEGEEAYEIYMELYDCGLSENDVLKNFGKLAEEIKSGEIDVGL